LKEHIKRMKTLLNQGEVFVTITCTRFSYLRWISSQRKPVICTKDFVEGKSY